MNTIVKILKVTALAAAILALSFSCRKESGENVAKAVLGDQSILTFTAKNPAAQTVTVYSDGPWHTTAPSWISVDPSTGDGVMTVTVTAQENADAGGLLEPRNDTLIFSGNTLASRLIILVNQEGDSYRNAEHLGLDKIAALADGKSFILDQAAVAAVTTAGYVLNDGTTNIYAKDGSSVKIGDKVSVKGLKGSLNNLPAITTVDELKVNSSGDFSYPEPKNLNEAIENYSGDVCEYVTVSGVVAGGNLIVSVNGVDYSIKQIDCPANLSISSLAGHKVALKGYTIGLLGAKQFGIITTERKDNGVDQLIYFEDDFEWMEPWTSASGAGDDVANNTVDTNAAPNVFANATQFADFIAEFQNRGYGYIWGWKGQDWSSDDPDNGNKRTLYLQRNYLKFGKTSYSSGIILPLLSGISGSDDIDVTFDWCWCMTGGSKPDYTSLALVVTGDGVFESTGTQTSEEILSEQPTEGDLTELKWQHATVRIKGATSATRITIRPFNNDPDITNAARHQNRWYLDNIKVLPADGGSGGGGGGVTPGTVVFEENFEWLEPYATAANAPDDVTSNSVGSSPNIFTTEALLPILAQLLSNGYAWIWGGKGMTEWSTAEPDSGNGRTLYLQKNYLKFGKSDWSSGLVLPALSALTATATVELTFDWCWCMTGGSKPDIMTLTAEVQGGASEELTSTQPTADDQTKLEWQHASVTFTGVTAESRISLHPTNVDPYISNTRGQNRWYLDNIKIVTK